MSRVPASASSASAAKGAFPDAAPAPSAGSLTGGNGAAGHGAATPRATDPPQAPGLEATSATYGEPDDGSPHQSAAQNQVQNQVQDQAQDQAQEPSARPSLVYSMTGYARTAGRISDALSFTLTLKSINHRYLDLQLRMPAGAEGLEAAVRQRLKDQLVRGHVECVLTLERHKPHRASGSKPAGLLAGGSYEGTVSSAARGAARPPARVPAQPRPEVLAQAQAPEEPRGQSSALDLDSDPNREPALDSIAGQAASEASRADTPRILPVTVPIFDPVAIAAYVTAFRDAARLHGLDSQPDLNEIARLPGMLLLEPPDTAGPDRSQETADDEALAREILARLGDVLAALRTMRAAEGASLAAILCDGLMRLEETVEEVALLRASVQEAHFARIRQRLDALLGGNFDRDRILQEAALLAERSDVEEEIARMRTHIQHFRALLSAGGELGKKLDFLLQEMNREANTLLSKTAGVTGNGTRITECGLSMKAEIEKAREQVQNLE